MSEFERKSFNELKGIILKGVIHSFMENMVRYLTANYVFIYLDKYYISGRLH